MTRELFLEIISRKLLFELVLIIVTYLIYWTILLKLGFQILEYKAGNKKLFPAVFIMFLNSFVIKQFIPISIHGVVMLSLVVILLTITTKVNVFKACWTALLICLITGIGDIIIVEPLCLSNKSITFFILKTPLGNAIGTLFELLIPLLTLIILKFKRISLIPPIIPNKIDQYDIIGIITFSAMYFLAYSTSMILLRFLKSNFRYALTYLFFLWITAITAGFGYYIIVTNLKKKNKYEQLQREQEQQRHESERLIYEERIAQLEQENQELAGLNEQLQANTIGPREAVAVMQDIIKRLQNAAKSTMEKSEKAAFLEKISNPAPVYLSPREKEVIASIACGMSNKAIAAALNLTEGTVKNIITKLLEKTELETRSQLAVYAAKNGLIDNQQ